MAFLMLRSNQNIPIKDINFEQFEVNDLFNVNSYSGVHMLCKGFRASKAFVINPCYELYD